MYNLNKVCLICPPSPFLLDERVFPFLGILRVAAAWEKQGIKIDVLDLCGIENYLDVISDYMRENADQLIFVGLTATTPQLPNACIISEYIRNNFPEILLVLGGPHVTLMHTAKKREKIKGIYGRAHQDIDRLIKKFNFLVCGDGELIFDLIIDNIKTGRNNQVVIDVDDRKSEFFLTDKIFSELPNPARHLIDLDTYKYYIDGERATSLISQLGCPFQCTFCSGRNSPFLRNIRSRSIDSIIKEMEDIYLTYGYKGFMFYDDELNVNKEIVSLMYAIANLGQKYGVQWKLRGFIKAELFTEEQAKVMYEAGFRILLVGFESGDPRILKNIRKRATCDDNTRCIEIARKYGLKIKALMSIGHAGENYESIENTKKWLLEVQPDDFDCTVITTYPGSPYFDDAVWDNDKYIFTSKDTGDKLYQSNLDYTKEVDYYKGVPGNYVSHVWTDYLSSEELAKERDKLEYEVRKKLKIPYSPSNPAIKYEHSMGSSRNFPDWILRSTETHKLLETKKQKIKLKVI